MPDRRARRRRTPRRGRRVAELIAVAVWICATTASADPPPPKDSLGHEAAIAAAISQPPAIRFCPLGGCAAPDATRASDVATLAALMLTGGWLARRRAPREL